MTTVENIGLANMVMYFRRTGEEMHLKSQKYSLATPLNCQLSKCNMCKLLTSIVGMVTFGQKL